MKGAAALVIAALAAATTHAGIPLRVDGTLVAEIDAKGRIEPVGDGCTTLIVRTGELASEVPVEVRGMDEVAVSFRRQVVPVLTKAGCNQGACHASQYGKGNFKLSLLGYAPEEDYPQFVRDWQQRRISLIAPEESLIIKKATLEK